MPKAPSRASSCCICVLIGGIVSAIGLLSVFLVYWSIPTGKPVSHHFTKVAAERFSSDVELHDPNPLVSTAITGTHSHVLFTWQSPLCAKHFDDQDHDPAQSRFHVQHWSDVSWKELLRSMSPYSSSSSGDTQLTVLPSSIYTNDCFSVLENARASRQISFRVRSRVDGRAMFPLFQPQWSVWSDTVVLPPAHEVVGEHDDDPAVSDHLWWGLTVASIATALYSRWSSAPESARGAAKRKIAALQEEVTNLKQELLDAETENKLLMRLKGYGLDTLSWKELHELERELHMGLETIELHKEALHPSLLDTSSQCSSPASSRGPTPPASPIHHH